MKIFILTEGGRNVGLGHITRCISLYEAFEKRGITPTLLIRGDRTARHLLKDKKYKIFNWLNEHDNLFSIIKDSDIVIVDSYLADLNFYKSISQKIRIPVYIDDYIRLNYPKGVVINGTILSEEMDYPNNKEITYLLGSRYTPIRKEFWNPAKKIIRQKIKTVIITFGGDDSHNMIPKILKALEADFPKLNKTIIIGRGFKNVKRIKSIRDDRIKLIYYPDALTMKKNMLESDVAISAGGQTLYELARIGVPTIAVAVSDNQMNNIKGMDKAGFIVYAGRWEDGKIVNKIISGLERLGSRKARRMRSERGKNQVDGKGVHRIVSVLLN